MTSSSIGDIYSVMSRIDQRKRRGIELEKVVISAEQGCDSCRSPLGAPGDTLPSEFYINYRILYTNEGTDSFNERHPLRLVNGRFRNESRELPPYQQNMTSVENIIKEYMKGQAIKLRRQDYRVEVIDQKDMPKTSS